MRVRYLLGLVLLAGAVYFALFGGDYSMLEVRRIRQETAAEAARLTELRGEVELLHARVDSLESEPEAIERIARERWGMIRPGERLYRFEGEASVKHDSRQK